MKRKTILSVIFSVMFVLLPAIFLSGCDGASSTSNADTLKFIGAEIAATGKASLPEETQENKYLLPSYPMAVVNAAAIPYMQGIYIEEKLYNTYNNVVKYETDRGDGVNAAVGNYIKADENAGTVDIYSLLPNVMVDGTQMYFVDYFSMMHIEYNFKENKLGDYWYTFTSAEPILNQDDEVTGYEANFTNVTLLHRKNGTLIYTPQIVDINNPIFNAGRSDPDYNNIISAFQSGYSTFNEKLNGAKASTPTEPSSDVAAKQTKAMEDLQSIYDVELNVSFGPLSKKDAEYLASKIVVQKDFNVVAVDWYTPTSGNELDQIDYVIITEEAWQEYHLSKDLVKNDYYNMEVVIKDSTACIKHYDRYYSIKDFKLFRVDSDNGYVRKYRYFYGDDYGDITREQYNNAINLLKEDDVEFMVYNVLNSADVQSINRNDNNNLGYIGVLDEIYEVFTDKYETSTNNEGGIAGYNRKTYSSSHELNKVYYYLYWNDNTRTECKIFFDQNGEMVEINYQSREKNLFLRIVPVR